MSTGTGTKTTAGAGLGRVLGVSSSQALVRVLLAVSSLALVALTSVAAPQGVVLGAVALFVLTVGTVWRPEAPAAGLLVIGLALHWLTAVPLPTSTASWLQLLVAAWLLLVVHLSAALAASLPPGAPVPGHSARRWSRRGAVVAAATVPLWALAYGASRQAVPGEVWLTYAAIAALAILTLAVWLLSRDPRP
ncbi:MAG: hypothetical protein WB473_15875 [Pedococcus sp.]